MPVIEISQVTDAQVAEVRESFLKYEGEEDIDESTGIPKRFDSRDIEQLKSDDVMVKYYITHSEMKVEDAVTMLKNSFAWRKEFGVRDINFDDFPEAIKSSNALGIHGADKENRRVLWMYMNRMKRTKNDFDQWCRYFAYHLEKLYHQRGDGRLIFVNDLSGVGLTSFDYEITGFGVKIFEQYYPDLLAFQVNVNMAWTLKTAWNIIKTWMKPESIARVKFVKGDELQQYVCSEFIPTHMGGQYK